MALSNQMEMFEDGGLKDEGGMTDEVSGNDVPSGSTREEVRDDIPAQLSEGEFVFPADVVRFLGLEKLMQMRQKAKMGLQKMEAMGQMGNSEEATMPDDMPFDLNDLDMEEDVDNEEDVEYNKGGVVKAAVGAFMNKPYNYDEQINPVTGLKVNSVKPYMPAKNILGASDPKNLVGGIPQTNEYGLGSQAGMDSEMFEQRRYVNETTGAVRFVSFNKATGQTTTNIKQLLDQGFIRKDEAIKEAAKAATPTPTYRPRPQEQDDGQSTYDEQQREEEEYGLGAGRISLGGSKDVAKTNRLGGEVRGGFLTKDAVTFGISFAKPGKDKFSLGKGLASAALGKLGGIGVSAIEAISYGNGNIPEGGTAKFTVNGVSIVKPYDVANAILKNPMGAEARALVEEHKDMMQKIKLLSESNKYTKKEAREVIEGIFNGKELYEESIANKEDGPDRIDDAIITGIQIKEQSDLDLGKTKPADQGVYSYTDPGTSDNDTSGGPETSGGEVSVSDSDFSGFYNKGGLAGKKKSKPKKMKLGGLASR